MSEETWTAEELFQGMTLQPEFITELEKHGLIRVVARDLRGGSLYSSEARDELEKVLALVELGYKLEDIAAIAKRVGLPAKRGGLFRRLPRRMGVEDLSRRSGVEPTRILGWVQRERLKADLISESGDPLFGRSAIERVRLLGDLEDAGVDEARMEATLSSLSPDTVQKKSAEELANDATLLLELGRELRAKRESIRRLERTLAAGRRRLIRARRALDTARRKEGRTRGARRSARKRRGEEK